MISCGYLATTLVVMTGRIAIVTGAGNGLGAAFAEALAAKGSAVVVNNRRHADRPFTPDEVVRHQYERDGGGYDDDRFQELHGIPFPASLVAPVSWTGLIRRWSPLAAGADREAAQGTVA